MKWLRLTSHVPFFFPTALRRAAASSSFPWIRWKQVRYTEVLLFFSCCCLPDHHCFSSLERSVPLLQNSFLETRSCVPFFFFLRTSIGTSPRSLCRSCLQRLFPPLFLALSPGYLLSFPLKHNGKKSVANACFSQGLNSGTTHHLLPSDRFSPSLNFYVRLRLRIELVGGIRAVGREDPMSFCGPSVFYWEHRCVQPVRAARVCGSVFSLHAVPAQRRQEHPKWKQRVVRRITLSPLFLCATAAEW